MRFLRHTIWLVMLLAGAGASVFGQQRCHSTEFMEQLLQQHPEVIDRMNSIEAHTARHLHQNPGSRMVVTIPTVVHVVYRTSTQNISDAQIQSQMDVLNEDFRRLNADADNVWSQAADAEIEFCLATVDPNGNPTNGITRTSTSKRSFSYSNDGVKFNSQGGKDAWPSGSYLNIWVCDLGNSLLGYAQFPGGPAATDGVVIDFAYFGRIGTATAPYELGRTATHEVGHWLNLRHIWGDGPCGVDDFVSDTPESDAANYACAIGHISCGSVDMVQNYMDYSYDGCMNLFTSGQKSRMQSLFAPGGVRASLLTSPGCGSTPPPGNEICDNNLDDDGDGLTDCADPDCASSPNCGTVTCDAPTGVTGVAANAGKNKAKLTLSWNAATGAGSYNAYVRKVGTTVWTSGSTTSTTIQFNGLDRNASYEYYVESVCAGGQTAASAISVSNTRLDAAASGLTLYPNPANDWLVVEFSGLTGAQGRVEVMDLVGKRVLTLEQTDLRDGYIELGLTELQAGVYLVRIEDETGESLLGKFVVWK